MCNCSLLNICIFVSSISGLMTRAIAESIFRQEEERSALRALQNKCSVTSLQFLECILTFHFVPIYPGHCMRWSDTNVYKDLDQGGKQESRKTSPLPCLSSSNERLPLRPIWEQWRLPMIFRIWLSSSNERLPETNLRGDQWRLPSGFKRNKPLCAASTRE